MALDTQYRPLKFDDVIGQESTVKVLKRFVETGTGFHQSYLFCGGFGSGKCVVGDTLVPTDKGVVPIQSLMGSNQVDPTDVLVLQEGGRHVRAAFTYRGGIRETVRIRTHLGFTLEGTPNHRIRVMTRNGEVDWANLGEIAVGDYACIVKGGPFGPGADLSGFTEHKSPPSGYQTHPFQAPQNLSPDWGRLIGYLVGDGSCSGDDVVISNSEKDTKEDILRLLRDLCGSGIETPDKRSKTGLSSLRCGRLNPRNFLEYAGLHKVKSGAKTVPWAIMASPSDVVREFLRGYMESDGSVGRGGIEVTTKSQRLAKEVQLLLLQFGIVSKLSEKTVAKYGIYHRISVLGVSYATYEKEIGFLSCRKRQSLRHLVSGASFKSNRSNKREVIPHQLHHLQSFYGDIPSSLRNQKTNSCFLARHGDIRFTKSKLEHIVANYQNEHFHKLASYDYIYDPIVNVEHGEAEVYDLNVPDGEMFAANGFMNHNTTLGRILARALLCDKPVGGDPCDQCSSCKSILERGSSECFVEVDAATNSGKDDIRKVVDLLQYDTYSGRRRIYLFDESHRLSKDALDALLKPMEDTIPGSQDKLLTCIFCTTEPDNMRKTIFSRCAPAFVIRMITPDKIADRLEYVCKCEGIPYDREALIIIAEAVECHVRDALKSVEGVSMMGGITVENVKEYLRLNANDSYLKILKSIGHDVEGILSGLDTIKDIVSPSTAYERIADLAMLAYRIGHGVGRPPIFWDRATLVSLWETHQSFLLQIAKTMAMTLGHPTYSMLECDLSSLHHHRRGGDPVPTVSPVFIKPAHKTLTEVQEPQQDISEIVVQSDHDSPNAGNGSPTPAFEVPKKVYDRPVVTQGGVYVNPRGVNKRENITEEIGTMAPDDFKRSLHRLLSELISDGKVGP